MVGYMFRALLVTAVTAGMLAGSAIEARAGLLDYIWDTSGPPYLGWVFRCRAVPKIRGDQQCDKIFGGLPEKSLDSPFWVSLESGIYLQFFKDGKDNDGEPIPFGIGHGVAFSFEPIVEFRGLHAKDGKWKMYHGAGASALVLASTDFHRVGNLGYKVRLVGYERGRWSASFNIRIFPDGFGADEFGAGAPPVGDRSTEVAAGFAIGF